MSEFTFLTKEQVIGDNKLEIFNNISTGAEITDFSILLGASTFNNRVDNKKLGWWLLKTACSMDRIYVDGAFDLEDASILDRDCGVRPAIKYSSISNFISNESSSLTSFTFGEYPQTVVDKYYSNILEYAYDRGAIKPTGKYYTTDSVYYKNKELKFEARKHFEYEYDENKYIRFVADNNADSETLSDGTEVDINKPYWIKVEPIEWVVDKKTGIAISKKIIFAGVQFKNANEYDGNFLDTDIKHFLDDYFSKEIVQGYTFIERKVSDNAKTNPYNFDLDNVSEEDIISGSIESDIPIFLHGPSSEGKSARVLEIDKDATIIYLANESPDTINGKSVYNEKNNEMIDIKPSWLVKLEEKCKDGKLHILFFYEITNAFPRVQGIVFNIILNKEVNGKWKLPDNARIVAAGNEMEDSLSANELSEPLFNRFSHVYIKTTTESWLKWASTHNIHPAIYSFIAYKNGSVLRSKYDGKKVNADPRKWEMASKMLYKTNNPAMLRSLVGEDITKEFLAFCSSRVITLEDVLADNYTNDDIESLNTAEKYATVMGLCRVDENNIRKVREFIKNMNPELLKVFDNLWANTENRLEILSEIELEKELVK